MYFIFIINIKLIVRDKKFFIIFILFLKTGYFKKELNAND
jgi:hypothetical protein